MILPLIFNWPEQVIKVNLTLREQRHDIQLISYGSYTVNITSLKGGFVFFELIKPHLALQTTNSATNLLRPIETG